MGCDDKKMADANVSHLKSDNNNGHIQALAQYQTIYRQDFKVPVCAAEYLEFRDYKSIPPPPWDIVELKPGIEPKVQKDRPKRFPEFVEVPAECPMCHPHIRKFDRTVTSIFKPYEPEIPKFKFELGQKRKIEIQWPNTEYVDTIHRFGRKRMLGKVSLGLKRKFFGRKKTEFLK